jgi:hypothetical protein
VWTGSPNDHHAWEGNIEDVIVVLIRDSGKPLVDLTGGGDVKDEPADKPLTHAGRTSSPAMTTATSSTTTAAAATIAGRF